jgi:outer membrane lipoprotein SlyB
MKFFLVALLAALLSGCFATPKGGGTYEPREHLGVGRAQPGLVIQVRLVRLAPDDRLVAAGGAIGGALGGVAGAKVAGNSGRAGAFVGSVLGGIAGAGLAAQQTADAHEIIVRMDSGATISVVQRDGVPVAAGQPVWVIGTGANTRVVPR